MHVVQSLQSQVTNNCILLHLILDARALFLVQSWSRSPTFDADSDSTPLHATTQQCNLTVNKHVNYTH